MNSREGSGAQDRAAGERKSGAVQLRERLEAALDGLVDGELARTGAAGTLAVGSDELVELIGPAHRLTALVAVATALREGNLEAVPAELRPFHAELLGLADIRILTSGRGRGDAS